MQLDGRNLLHRSMQSRRPLEPRLRCGRTFWLAIAVCAQLAGWVTVPATAQVIYPAEPEILDWVVVEELESEAEADPSWESVLQRLEQAEQKLKELEGEDSENAEEACEACEAAETEKPKASVQYGDKGFKFTSEDEKFSLAIQNRIQARFASPFDGDPRVLSDLERDENSFMIRRARTRFAGHAYVDWLEYYFQYDWTEPILRDLNLTISKFKWATLEIGRGKVIYNDERKTSSGRQQFVNRSIVNDLFTVDRQQGVQLYGNLFPDTWYDTTYYLGVFTGLGVGERNNDDEHLMYNARLQWNALGGEMPFSQSDIEFHEQPALSFAIAANTNRSPYLVYATADESGLPLPWAPYDQIGAPGQYRINQMMGEIRFKWQGFSLLHEMHAKEIVDKLAPQSSPFKETTMLGGFIQAGYFPHYLIPIIPKKLEVAGRYAAVDPNLASGNIEQQEASGVITYFFNGHNNKLNFQVSDLTLNPDFADSRSEQRYWLQWDITF